MYQGTGRNCLSHLSHLRQTLGFPMRWGERVGADKSFRFPHSLSRVVFLIAFWFLFAVPTSFASFTTSLSFEDAPNGTVISDTLNGLDFSVLGGAWRFGDVRASGYNAPYPRGAFAVDGNGFAWTAQAPGDARIAFTEGTATFFVAEFSTKDTLTVTGYDGEGREVDSAVVRANANTGRLDPARLEAPAGQGLAYVVIRGTQNRWIMDNLETDAPLPAERGSAEPALVTVAQLPSPNLAAASGSVVSYEIVATNRGRGPAKGVQITVPFDPAEVAVLDARFSRGGAWVSSLLTDTLRIDTGPLGGGGDVLTATVRLRVLPGVAEGEALGERLTFRWTDRVRGGSGQSNLPALVAGQETADAPTYPLALEQPAPRAPLGLSSPLFIPNEPVAVWYDTPNGRSVAAGVFVADSGGSLRASLSTAELPPGRYQIVAHGQWSNLTAAGVVELQ